MPRGKSNAIRRALRKLSHQQGFKLAAPVAGCKERFSCQIPP
jgi:hypothetical protein